MKRIILANQLQKSFRNPPRPLATPPQEGNLMNSGIRAYDPLLGGVREAGGGTKGGRKRLLQVTLALWCLLAAWATTIQADEGGLVAYWSFDEGSGSVVQDRSGAGLNGLVCGDAVWVKEGKYAGAMRFNGNGAVDFGVDERLDMGLSSFTIASWVNVNDAPQGVAIGKYNCLDTYYGYGFWGELNGKNLVFTLNGDKGTGECYWLTVNFPISQWVHIAITVDREKGQAVYYENGAVKKMVDISKAKGPVLSAYPFKIGRIHGFGGVQRYMQGMVDETAIWKRVLNGEEIKTVMQNRIMELGKK